MDAPFPVLEPVITATLPSSLKRPRLSPPGLKYLRGGPREHGRRRVSVWASALEALRRRRAPPEARLAEIGLAKGMKVADIGAGYGYFAFPAAEMVGEEGLVYAVEPNPRRAEEVSRRADERGVKNIKVLVAGAEDLAGIPA